MMRAVHHTMEVRAALPADNFLDIRFEDTVTDPFGVLASIFGVMVVKTDDREDPLHAIARGLYVYSLLYLALLFVAISAQHTTTRWPSSVLARNNSSKISRPTESVIF